MQVYTINDYFIMKLVMDCYLEQRVCTNYRDNNILDLILTNEMSVKDGIHMLAPVDKATGKMRTRGCAT